MLERVECDDVIGVSSINIRVSVRENKLCYLL